MALINKGGNEVTEVIIDGEKHIFVDSVISLLAIISNYCYLTDHLPKTKLDIGIKITELLKLFNSRTCQLVLGAGAVSVAGLKTITIRHLAVTRTSLALSSLIIKCVKNHLMELCTSI